MSKTSQLLDKLLGQDTSNTSSPFFSGTTQKLQDINSKNIELSDKSTPLTSVYNRLNDGSYVPKYENILNVGTDENRLAKEQSGTEQAINGVLKFGLKSLNYAVDGIGSYTYGAFQATKEGDFNKMWNNDLTDWLDDNITIMESEFPNYYTDKQKEASLVSNLASVNLWADKFLGGAAFLTGAALAEVPVALATGGVSLGTAITRESLKTGFKATVKSTVPNFGRKVLRETAKKGTLARATSNLAFAGRSSAFEAGVESRGALDEAVTSYINQYEKQYGVLPTVEGLRDFTTDAVKMSNMVFVANAAVLMPSNLVMFGKTMGVTSKLMKSFGNKGNSILGLGFKKDGSKLVAQELSLPKKILGNSYFIMKAPLTEGVWEEGGQGIISKTMQNYITDKYDSNTNLENLSLLNSFLDASKEQFTTKEGWEEIGIGMMLGSFGKVFTGQGVGIEGVTGGTSYSSARQNTEDNIKSFNENTDRQGSVMSKFNNYTTIVNKSGKANEKLESKDILEAEQEDVSATYGYISSGLELMNEDELVNNYETFLELQEYSTEQLDELGIEPSAIKDFKEGLLTKFTTQVRDFKDAKKTVENLNIEQAIDEAPANIRVLKDAFTFQFFQGIQAKDVVKKLGKQIDNVTQQDGALDALQFVNNLKGEQKEQLTEYKSSSKKLKVLRDRVRELGVVASGNVANKYNQYKKETALKKQQIAQQEIVRTQQEIIDLETRLDTLKSSLSKGFNVRKSFSINESTEGFDNVNNPFTLDSTLEVLDNIDSYVETLSEVGKESESNYLTGLVSQFKLYSDINREFTNTIDKINQDGFFNNNKGIVNKIIGKKYKVSEELKESISKNEDKINDSLKRSGFSQYVQEKEDLVKSLEENTNLSEREKAVLDVMLRAVLNKKNEGLAKDIIENTTVETVKEENEEGDTLLNLKLTKIEKSGISNSKQLDEYIKQVISKINSLGVQTDKLLKETEESEDGTEVDNVTQEDYTRFSLLTKKFNSNEIGRRELTEYYALKNKIDQWHFLQGIEIGDVKLSDLIEQKVLLESEPILDVHTDSYDVTLDEKLPFDLGEKQEQNNLDIVQSQAVVTAVQTSEGVEIQGISKEDLSEELEGVGKGDVIEVKGKEIKVKTTEINNIVISREDVEWINDNTKLSISRLSKVSQYTTVTKRNSNNEYDPLMSVHPYETDVRGIDEQEIYNLTEEDSVTLEIDTKDPYLEKILDKHNGKKSKKLIDELVSRLPIKVVLNNEEGGSYLGLLKGLVGKSNLVTRDSLQFVALRRDLVEKNIDKILAGEEVIVTGESIPVRKVLLGHPNFNLSQDSSTGNKGVIYKTTTSMNTSNVVDVGFIENGDLRTRKNRTYRKTFISRLPKTEKVPVVVIKHNGQEIVYPVRMREDSSFTKGDLSKIMNSKTDIISKVKALNQVMLEAGIDINIPGNAFEYISAENNNLTQDFLQEKVTQMENVKFFYNIEDSIDTKVDVSTFLNKTEIDINLKNPFYSPKFSLDLSVLNRDIEIPDVIVEKSNKETKKKVSELSISNEDLLNLKEGCNIQ